MINIIELLKKIDVKLLLILYLLCISIIAAIFFYMPSPDEWNYMHETILISELFKDGLWIGDQFVGTHGFVFKIIPALVFLIFEPTIYIPYFYHILLNLLTIIYIYEIAFHLFKSKKYAFIATFLLINTTLFLQFSILNAYLRETPALFSIALLFYLILKKKNFNFVLIAILLTIEAKEYIGIGAILSYLIYLIIEIFEKYNKKYFRIILHIGYKSLLILFVLIGWLYLMFSTSIIPENHSWSVYLGLDLNSTIYKYEAKVDYSLSDSLRKIDSLKKWEFNRDSTYRFFDNIKYQNEFKQTVNYQYLKDEIFDIEIDSSTNNGNSNSEGILNQNHNFINSLITKVKNFINRILSINGFNYSSVPIFLIIIVLMEVIFLIKFRQNLKDWTLIIAFFLLIFGLYIQSDYIPRYFYPAIFPISLIFTHAVRYNFYSKWFIILLLSISLPLTFAQIIINEFTPTFFVAVFTQLLIFPLIWINQDLKKKYIYFFVFSLIFSFWGYQSVILFKDLTKEARGDYEYNLRKYSSYFDIDNDSLVYLTHRLYPGRTTNQTIRFYNKSNITLNDESSFVHFLSPKVPKHNINKYYKQNLFDMHTITKWNEFPDWNILKSEYLIQNKINRVVFVMYDDDELKNLNALFSKKDYFFIQNLMILRKDYDYWMITEQYKNLLFKYRPSWLKLISKNKLDLNSTIYIFEISENNN